MLGRELPHESQERRHKRELGGHLQGHRPGQGSPALGWTVTGARAGEHLGRHLGASFERARLPLEERRDRDGPERSAAVDLDGRERLLGVELSTEHGLSPVLRGSAGTGVLFAGLGEPLDPTAIGAFLADLRAGCHLFGGSAIVLRAPVAIKGALDVWGPVPALDLMRRVKQQFDPERRLAPGRFAGGI